MALDLNPEDVSGNPVTGENAPLRNLRIWGIVLMLRNGRTWDLLRQRYHSSITLIYPTLGDRTTVPYLWLSNCWLFSGESIGDPP